MFVHCNHLVTVHAQSERQGVGNNDPAPALVKFLRLNPLFHPGSSLVPPYLPPRALLPQLVMSINTLHTYKLGNVWQAVLA